MAARRRGARWTTRPARRSRPERIGNSRSPFGRRGSTGIQVRGREDHGVAAGTRVADRSDMTNISIEQLAHVTGGQKKSDPSLPSSSQKNDQKLDSNSSKSLG